MTVLFNQQDRTEQKLRNLVAQWQNETDPKRKKQIKATLEITLHRMKQLIS